MFKEVLLEALNRTEGCLGVLIMGTDGIPVERAWQPLVTETNLDVAVAEYTSIVRNAQRTNREMGLGALNEVVLSSESGIFILRFIGKDYFIVMILAPEGNFGRGRYELRRAELLLEKEFVI
jgi:predicted regulator of Ras-like GTPase activity (Roadblock/LC7/MglB family)